MSILLTIALYILLMIVPLIMYHIASLDMPFWYWSAGLVSGLTIWYLNTILTSTKTTPDIPTDEPPVVQKECSTCFYHIDHCCWYKYYRCANKQQCEYRPKSARRI